ncbi:MAG TPA: molybdenum cofactor guanylyltransferase [Pyrinomonadaceae bacterium]|nr:molybdenum cofactor guanylyltransferase [Pyrinomonadaceae bacterium]
MDGSLRNNISQFQGFILAGGQSRRMGRDKSQLLLNNRTFTEKISDTLLQITDSILVVRADRDIYPDWGALGGLHAALAACRREWAIVVACDLPFVTAQLFNYLTSLRDDHDAIVPLQPDQRPQPLCALYRIEPCLPRATEMIETGHRRPRDLLELVNTRWVPFTELRNLHQAEKFFVNINTPEDYDAIRGHSL